MSFYVIVYQLLAAETLQIPPRRQPRKKFMLVALSLLACYNCYSIGRNGAAK